MLVCTKRLFHVYFSFLVIYILYPTNAQAQSVSLYTPFTKIVAPPGKNINYSVEVINNSNSIKTSNIKVIGLPKDWSYELKSGGWLVEQISTLPKKEEKLSLNVNVPLKVNKGAYHFKVLAEGYTTLPLTIIVSKEGTYQTEFASKQYNIEGASNSTFTYNATLRNGTAESQVYALKALAPPGWNIIFKSAGKQISSLNIEANKKENITINVNPPSYIKSGTYKIPILANADNNVARLELETVITGTYDIDLGTPTGLLSTDVTAGDSKKLKVLVKNTGSTPLNNIKLNAQAPSNWTVTFTPKEVPHLDAGKTKEVEATIEVDNKALSGDYETKVKVRSQDASTDKIFRVTVHASVLSGWLGILIILMALSSVYFLIRKYGRR